MALTVVDAGVVIGVLAGHDAHHPRAKEALAAARDRGDRLVLPASAYAEVLVGPRRAGGEAADVVDRFLDAVPISIAPIDRRAAAHAAELRGRHRSLRLPDALVIAVAIELGADRLVTTDSAWPDVAVRVEVLR